MIVWPGVLLESSLEGIWALAWPIVCFMALVQNVLFAGFVKFIWNVSPPKDKT